MADQGSTAPATTTTLRSFWNTNEDQILLRLASLQPHDQPRDWNTIASSMPGRSNKDCRKRWIKLSKQLNKGPWISEEDVKLDAAVRQFGARWTLVSTAVGTRSPDQCAKRWRHSLDPQIDHSDWLSEDEVRLAQAVKVHGRNWVSIAENEFPRRSPTDLKNKYICYQRKQKQEESIADQTCNEQMVTTMEEAQLDDVLSESPFDYTWTDFNSITMQDAMLVTSTGPQTFASPETLHHTNQFALAFDPYLTNNNIAMGLPSPAQTEQPESPEMASSSAYGSSSSSIVNKEESTSTNKVTISIENIDQDTASDIIQYLMKKKSIQINVKMQTSEP